MFPVIVGTLTLTELTETQAKGLVARIQGQGSICPARWDAGA